MKAHQLFKLSMLLIFSSIGINLNAQIITADWATSMGGGDQEESWGIVVDDSNYVYTAGFFKGTCDFDPGTGVMDLVSNGDRDIFVTKQDSTGALVWARAVGGTGFDWGFDIDVDSDGNVYVVGIFQNTVDFDPGAGLDSKTSAGASDMFIWKLDLFGNHVYTHTFGSAQSDEIRDIAIDENDNIFVAIQFRGTIDFDPGIGNTSLTAQGGSVSAAIAKFDNTGNLVWAKHVSESTTTGTYGVAVSPSGDVYATGFFYATGDFDPGIGTNTITNAGGGDLFLSKFDASGTYQWAKGIGGTSEDQGWKVTTDKDGDVLLTGVTEGTLDLDPGAGVNTYAGPGGSDILIAKFDDSGNQLWAHGFGGDAWDWPYGIAVDSLKNVYTTGQYYRNPDWDPGVGVFNLYNSGGNTECFVSILSPNGDFVNAASIGRAFSNEKSTGIAVTDDHKIYVSGNYAGDVDFDPSPADLTLNSISWTSDVFVVKWDASPCGTSSSISESSCGDYTSPSGKTFTSTGIYLDTIVNNLGCDSIITINLTVLNNSSGTDTQTACDSYTWIDGNTYTASNNTATHVLTNAAGCDSTVTLDLTINNSTTGTDTQIACDSFTWIDGNTYTASNNTATHVLTNAAGCDSTVTLDLTINNSTTGTDTQIACDSFTWIDGNTYTASNNTATHVLTNAAGCDSTVTLDLTINNSTTGTDTQIACDSFTWIDGNTYTASNNTATHVLTNAAGCDSTVTLDLTINNSTTGTDTQIACDSFTWIDGNTYTASNNTATHVLTNAAGCDSTVTLDLTINNSTTGTDTQEACDPFTWIDGNTYTAD